MPTSKLKDRTWVRNIVFALFQPLIPPLGLFPTIIHEAAHWISALIIGVPISEIKIGWYILGPGVEIPTSTPTELLPYFFYSGGITASIVILLLYIFYWIRLYYRVNSSTNWILSMFILFSFAFQLYIGLLEGKYYHNYPAHLNDYPILLLMLIVFLIHVLIFFLLSKYKKRTLHKHSIS